MSWYILALKQYATFSGRSTRKEYWMFVLVSLIIVFALGVFEGIAGIAPNSRQSVLANLYQLAVLIPTIAVGVRRMHDTNHRGWWLFFPIANLVLACQDSDRGENRYGPDPKATTATASM